MKSNGGVYRNLLAWLAELNVLRRARGGCKPAFRQQRRQNPEILSFLTGDSTVDSTAMLPVDDSLAVLGSEGDPHY
jgi:hypothetical protein